MTALEVLIDETAAGLGLDPVEFRRRNLLANGRRTMLGNVISGYVRSAEVLDRLAAKPLWTGARRREGAPRGGVAGQALRRRPRLPDHGIRRGLRPGLCAGRDRSRRPHHALLAGGRDRHRHRHRARRPRRREARDRRGRGEARRPRCVGRARPHRAGRSVLDHRRAPARGGEGPALGARRPPGHHRLQRRPCPHRGRGRGGQHHPPLRPLSGGDGDLVRQGRGRSASTSASRTSASSTAGSPPAASSRWRSPKSPPRRTRWASSPRRWSTATTAGPGRPPSSTCPTAATRAPSTRSRCRYGSGAPADRKALMTIDGWHRFDRVSVDFPPVVLAADRRRLRQRGRHHRRRRDRPEERRRHHPRSRHR